MYKLIWTRSVSERADDLKLMSDLNPMLFLPCIRTEFFDLKQDEKEAWEKSYFSCVVFTSLTGAKASLGLPWLKKIVTLANSVFCLGQKTNDFLASHNINACWFSECHTAKDLADNIIPLLNLKNETILLPGAQERAFAMAEYFAAKGFNAKNLSIYKTVSEVDYDTKLEPIDLLKRELTGVVCFASPSAIKGFVKFLGIVEGEPTKRFRAVTIGPSTSKVARLYFSQLSECSLPSLSLLYEQGLCLYKQGDRHIP